MKNLCKLQNSLSILEPNERKEEKSIENIQFEYD